MTKREQRFVELVWKHYREQGRHDLPWRKTDDPYKILVSEVMLQQTQVDRVLPMYQAFLKRFPTARRLAAAPLGDVLRAWQGLGYNRRAKFLWQAAGVVVEKYQGVLPEDKPGLRSLPGVGPYTAGAVMAFAYNEPVVLIETNVRQVFIHHFFRKVAGVHDAAILNLVQKTMQTDDPREWYWALMDYGAYLKAQHGNINHKSRHYTKQFKFQGSDRQIRGLILKVLVSAQNPLTEKQLRTKLVELGPRPGVGADESGRVATQLAHLVTEGLVQKTRAAYRLH